MITCAFAETSSREQSMPREVSSSISSSSTRGSTTTPSAMTVVMCGYRIPEGIRWSRRVRPPARTVWPALFPP